MQLTSWPTDRFVGGMQSDYCQFVNPWGKSMVCDLRKNSGLHSAISKVAAREKETYIGGHLMHMTTWRKKVEDSSKRRSHSRGLPFDSAGDRTDASSFFQNPSMAHAFGMQNL